MKNNPNNKPSLHPTFHLLSPHDLIAITIIYRSPENPTAITEDLHLADPRYCWNEIITYLRAAFIILPAELRLAAYGESLFKQIAVDNQMRQVFNNLPTLPSDIKEKYALAHLVKFKLVTPYPQYQITTFGKFTFGGKNDHIPQT